VISRATDAGNFPVLLGTTVVIGYTLASTRFNSN
jgi:hypothetical protein